MNPRQADSTLWVKDLCLCRQLVASGHYRWYVDLNCHGPHRPTHHLLVSLPNLRSSETQLQQIASLKREGHEQARMIWLCDVQGNILLLQTYVLDELLRGSMSLVSLSCQNPFIVGGLCASCKSYKVKSSLVHTFSSCLDK